MSKLMSEMSFGTLVEVKKSNIIQKPNLKVKLE
jgi:hypothetical protein